MSFTGYLHKITKKIEYCFENETHKLLDLLNNYIKLPPNPKVVHSTSAVMTDDPVLDSIVSIYELDRVLNLEASQAKEDQEYQKTIIER